MKELQLLSLFIEFIGTLMVVYAALRVHHRFLHEHQVDEELFVTMKSEQTVALLGIFFITIGFFINLYILL